MDFSQLLREAQSPAPTEPRELYRLLADKKPGYGYLRDVQAQVLMEWHERRDEPDLLIRVNTGGGKTIDGLVILQSYINEGIGPSLYVAPNDFLAGQVEDDATKIGIPTVRDPEHPAYLASEAIAIVNAHKLFNGRTVFSDRRASKAPVPIGAVLIDDAHAAERTVKDCLSLKIPRTTAAYGQLLELFAEEMRQQSQEKYLDVFEEDRNALAQVPFWAWRAKTERARVILRPLAKAYGDPLYFEWPAVSEVLPYCRAVFDSRNLTITPHLPPISHATAFKNAKRRIYLSATLPNESILVSGFDADPTSIAQPITPLAAGDIGERLILAPQAISPHVTDDAIRRKITELSKIHNTVVIVPSTKTMDRWPDADRRASAKSSMEDGDIDEVVAELKSGEHIGLVLVANQYDGIDLPQDACRILVIDGLPESFSGEDRLESLQTSYENGVDLRQVQRIEQGMGRGVRSNEDHCVVILLGHRIAQLTVDPRTVELFSPATKAQLKMSRAVANGLSNRSLTEILSTAEAALKRDADWVKFAKQALRDVPDQAPAVSQSSIARRKAFDAALFGDLDTSVQVLQQAANVSASPKEKGWLLEQAATYLDHTNANRAQTLLVEARRTNSHTAVPLSGVAFQKLDYVGAQPERCVDFLTASFSGAAALRLGFEAALDDLVFDPDRVDAFEEALFQLGKLIGLESERPERDGSGPDNLWCLGANTYWIIEAKTGSKTSAIAKRDAGQLGQAVEWFRQRYGKDATAIPVLVHKATVLWKDATPVPGMQVLSESGMNSLVDAARAFSTSLAGCDFSNAAKVSELLQSHKLTAGNLKQYLSPARIH